MFSGDSRSFSAICGRSQAKLLLALPVFFFITILLFSFLGTVNTVNDVPLEKISNNDSKSFFSILSDPDEDGDGLSDTLEEDTLGTNKSDKYGDKDGDGLYDFEEYLDIYGTPENNADEKKYDYDSANTYEGVLDIYHLFGLTADKSGYLRDELYNTTDVNFTDYLLWNVTFNENYAAGTESGGTVVHSGNLIHDCIFSRSYSGGSENSAVIYANNTIVNTNYTRPYAGGSEFDNVTYQNNSLINVTFEADYTGGSVDGVAIYKDNNFSKVIFAGKSGGLSANNTSIYTNNSFSDVNYLKAEFSSLNIISSNNIISLDPYDSDNDGLSDLIELFSTGTHPKNNDTDGDGLNDSYEVNMLGTNASNIDTDGDGLNDSYELWTVGTKPRFLDSDLDKLNDGYEVLNLSTNPLLEDTDNDGLSDRYEVLTSMTNPVLFDSDFDGLNDSYEVLTAMTNALLIDTDGDRLTDSYELMTTGTDPLLVDTDGDGLNDAWEVTYENVSGVDPLKSATSFELKSDLDNDELTLQEEEMINSDPNDFDTDGDRMGDGWELEYLETLGVHPLIGAFAFEINLDLDGDGLTLLEEGLAGTNPNVADTDEDGLEDGWEVAFTGSEGVDPFVKVTEEELDLDEDNDGLSILEESMAGTNPASNDTDGDGLGDLWEVTYKGARGVDPIVKATPQDLLYDQDGDGFNLLEEALMNTDPEEVNILDLQSDDEPPITLTLPWILVLSIFLVTFGLSIVLAIVQRRRRQREKKWETLL